MSITLLTSPIIFFHMLLLCNIMMSLNNYVETNLVIANTPTLSRGGILNHNGSHELFTGYWSLPVVLCEQINKHGYDENFVIDVYVPTDCNYSLPEGDGPYTDDIKLYTDLMIVLLVLLILIFAVFMINIIMSMLNVRSNIQKWMLFFVIAIHWILLIVQLAISTDFIRDDLIDPQPDAIVDVNMVNIRMMYFSSTITFIVVSVLLILECFNVYKSDYNIIV